jgi:malto-oligosyltrehalose trehalohydrolase
MPFGAEVTERGVRFSIWAPAAREAMLHVDGREVTMPRDGRGFFTTLDETARAGSRYAFSFDTTDLHVPDPASRFNPEDVHAPSEVIDPGAFLWSDAKWRGRPWREAVIYELHVGTFTPAGTYAGAEERLDYLADLGITAIELMPLADTPGKQNWGYDGVLPFAPEHGFGRPEALKRFVQSAHERGLMVLLDVVYNHFGPDGNYLHLYASQFFTAKHHTPWGNGINFDDDASEIVRQFFIHNALYWLEEYHFDGLRLDAVHAIADDSDPTFLSDLATAVRGLDLGREVHLVLENDDNNAAYLRRTETGEPALYTAQWNDDFHHALHVIMTGERRGHYEDYERPAEQLLRALLEGFVFQGETSRYRGDVARGEPSAHLPAEAFVNFLQNHDQIGNRPDGKRMWMLTPPDRMLAAETLLAFLPTPILMFMGDEFHAPSLFPFFCDFSGDLAAAVNEGRRREFAKLASHHSDFDTVPLPNTPEARAVAVLDWNALRGAPHSEDLERQRAWLRRRREALVPRLPPGGATGELIGEQGFRVTWPLADGTLLALVANLGGETLALPSPPARPPAMREVLAETETIAPTAPALPPWYVSWTVERRE